MGSGKTRISLEALKVLDPKPCNPTIIACPTYAIAHWKVQIRKWYDPEAKIIVARGEPASRHIIWREMDQYDFIITTVATLLLDKEYFQGKEIPVLIADEYHKYLRNRKNATFKMFKSLRYDVFMPMTGTPFRNGPQDVWPILHLCNKARFSSFWKFANTFIHVFDGPYGKEFLGPRNVENFRRLLRTYCVYIHPDELAGALPKRNRQRLEVELGSAQKRLYEQLLNDLLVELGSGQLVVMPTELSRIIKLRQVLACPKIIDPDAGYGIGIETVAEHMEDDPHCVIFTPFRPAVDYFVEFLTAKGYNVYKLYGGVSSEEQTRITEEFQRNRGILVCTIAVAESWEVLTPQNVYFVGYEWSPDTNEQAEDRLRRVSSTHPYINFHYILCLGTFDDRVLEVVTEKHINVSRTINTAEGLKKLTKGTS